MEREKEASEYERNEQRLFNILEERRALFDKIGSGVGEDGIKATDNEVSAVKVGRARQKVDQSIQRIEQKLQKTTFEQHYREAEDLYRQGYLTDEEILPHRLKAEGLKLGGSVDQNEAKETDTSLLKFIADQTEENQHTLQVLMSSTLDHPLSSDEIADRVNENYPQTVSEWGTTYGRFGSSDISGRMRYLQSKLNKVGYTIVKVVAGENRKSGYLIISNENDRRAEDGEANSAGEIVYVSQDKDLPTGAKRELHDFLDRFRKRERTSSWSKTRKRDIDEYGDESLYGLLPEELNFRYSAISRTFMELASHGITTRTALSESDLDSLDIIRSQSTLRPGNVGYELATILQKVVREETVAEEKE